MKLFSRLLRPSKFVYDIPDEYQNSFYLANASLFQIVNYFVHKSYQVAFPELVEKVKAMKYEFSDMQAKTAVRQCIKSLEYCNHFVDMHYPFKRRNGDFTIIRGMRAYHGILNNKAALGGFRMHENIQRHTMQGFAVLSTYRSACFGLDLAGSHGGLKINAVVYEPDDIKDVTQVYVKNLAKYSGIMDVIEPDMYATRNIMDYMHEVAERDKICITGKHEFLGGIPHYESGGPEAVVSIIQQFLQNRRISTRINLGGPLKDMTFIIHGLGRTGVEILKMMNELGAICVGVREYNCVIYDTSGLPVKALLKHYKKFGTIMNFSNKSKDGIDADNIFSELCDILILAAVERSVTCHIADLIKAKVIVEACNGPITPTADKILVGKMKLVIPSILAGGGHSLLSYLEYMKSLKIKDSEESSKVNDGIVHVFNGMIIETTAEVIQIEQELNLNFNFREAAYVKAIRKIFDKLLEKEVFFDEKQRMLNMQ